MVNPRLAASVRRYARALLDVAVKAPCGPAGVRERLATSAALLAQLPEARAFLTHPGVPRQRKEALVNGVLGETEGHEPVARLVWLLIDRQRLSLLPAIEEAFIAEWNKQRGVAEATVTSAVPLSDAQTSALRAALAAASRLSIELTAAVDPELGGGLVVKIGGRTLDGTVRGRLRMLREHLRQAAVAR